jgi:hypothetical protein
MKPVCYLIYPEKVMLTGMLRFPLLPLGTTATERVASQAGCHGPHGFATRQVVRHPSSITSTPLVVPSHQGVEVAVSMYTDISQWVRHR